MNRKKTSSIVYFILALLGLSIPVAAIFLIDLMGVFAIILFFFGFGLNAVVVCLLYRENRKSNIVYLILALLSLSIPVAAIFIVYIFDILGVLLFFGGFIFNAILVSVLFSQAPLEDRQPKDKILHAMEKDYKSKFWKLIVIIFIVIMINMGIYLNMYILGQTPNTLSYFLISFNFGFFVVFIILLYIVLKGKTVFGVNPGELKRNPSIKDYKLKILAFIIVLIISMATIYGIWVGMYWSGLSETSMYGFLMSINIGQFMVFCILTIMYTTGKTRFGTKQKELIGPSEVTPTPYKFEQQRDITEQRERLEFCQYCNEKLPEALKSDLLNGKSVICPYCGQDFSLVLASIKTQELEAKEKELEKKEFLLKKKMSELNEKEGIPSERVQCPNCRQYDNYYIKTDTTRIIGYKRIPIYAKKYVCKGCGYEWVKEEF